jgi:hypothetical protein
MLWATHFRSLGVIFLVCGIAASCSRPQPLLSSNSEALYGLGLLAVPWPGGNVPVCFQASGDHPEFHAAVHDAVSESWAKVANISFSGFGACAGSGNAVAIGFVPGARANTNGLGYGPRTIALDPNVAATWPDWFKAIVMHEFGHALGFLHEMERPDNWDGTVPSQCTVAPTDPDHGNYDPWSGGLYLTAHYDSNSIMNYCGPGGPTLSVGDILGVSSPSAYGPSACRVVDGTACFTYSVPACFPTKTGWVMKRVGGGALPHACLNGAQPGTCPSNEDPATFVLGSPADTTASTQQYVMCDAFDNCGTPPFSLSIASCGPSADGLYLTDDRINVTQAETSFDILQATGPWLDGGVSFQAAVISSNVPHGTFTFRPGYASQLIDVAVAASTATPPGDYSATVQVTNVLSGVARTVVIPVHVWACTPPPACGRTHQCGVATGCGQSVDCGSCASGNTCSYGFCCPNGTFYDTNSLKCVPECHCSDGFYCDVNGVCQPDDSCGPLGSGLPICQ